MAKLVGFRSWDVAWWCAWMFLVGSLFWSLNGIIVFHQPIPTTGEIDSPRNLLNRLSAFGGGFCFFWGGIFMYLQGLNEKPDTELRPFKRTQRKQQKQHEAHEAKPPSAPPDMENGVKDPQHTDIRFEHGDCCTPSPEHFGSAVKSLLCNTPRPCSWRWFGWLSIWDLAFMSNFTQGLGTTVFFISVVSTLPRVLPYKETGNWELYFWLSWLLQIIGAFFLFVSSVMMTLLSQNRWYLPRPLDLEWHVGFWNLIGSTGFWLSGFFGAFPGHENTSNWVYWGVYFSTYWGSYAFLVGSYLQYYQTLNPD